MTRSRPLAAALALALALIPETALADPPPTKSACAAANESAQHAWQAHQLLRARADLLACVTDTCPAPVRQDCARRLDEVEVSTPSIVFEIRDVAGGDVPRASISIDGEPPAPNSGAAVDLDPGEHSIRFEAPGFGPSTKTIVAVEGVKVRREAVTMLRLDRARTRAIPTGPRPPPPAAWAAFAAGGAGLALGLGAGLVAVDEHSTLQGECGSTCPPQLAGELSSFHTWRTVSTVGYLVGGLGIASGVAIWLLSPASAPRTGLLIGPGISGVAGTF